MSNLREFTWSARVVQFLPLAGAIAVARRSVPAAGLFLAWLLGYVVVKGAASVATIESGSYWRLVMPALPAFVLLTAAIPLLVPTLVDRREQARAASRPQARTSRDSHRRHSSSRRSPLAVLLASDSAAGGGAADAPGWVRLPTGDRGRHRCSRGRRVVSLTVRRSGKANELTWTDSTERARPFYRLYRASPSRGFLDMVCELRGVDRCELRAETLTTTRARRYVDPSPRRMRSTGWASPRIGSTIPIAATLRDQSPGRAVRG